MREKLVKQLFHVSLNAQNLIEGLPVVLLGVVLAEHPHDVRQGLVLLCCLLSVVGLG